MAVSVAYGLLIVTFLLLALLPLLLVTGNDLMRFMHRMRTGEEISKRDAESAVKEMKWEEKIE